MAPENKKYAIVISTGANDRMAEHFEFLGQVNEQAAYRLLDKLIEDIQTLEERPNRNPAYTRPYTPPGKYRYLLSAKRYRIVYTIENETVYVDDIQDCRQDDDKSLISEE